MFCILKKESPVHVSKYNSNRQKHVVLLMIPNGEEWHYFAKKTISISNRNNFCYPKINFL